MIDIKFTIEELMELVMPISQLRAKDIKDKDGVSQFENLSITEDDKDLVEMYSEDIVEEMGDMLVYLTSSIPGAISDVSPYGVTITDNGNHNKNSEKTLKAQFKEFFKASILYNWYNTKGVVNDTKVWEAKAMAIKLKIVNESLFHFSMRS